MDVDLDVDVDVDDDVDVDVDADVDVDDKIGVNVDVDIDVDVVVIRFCVSLFLRHRINCVTWRRRYKSGGPRRMVRHLWCRILYVRTYVRT